MPDAQRPQDYAIGRVAGRVSGPSAQVVRVKISRGVSLPALFAFCPRPLLHRSGGGTEERGHQVCVGHTAGVCQAAEMSEVFDGGEQAVVVVGNAQGDVVWPVGGDDGIWVRFHRSMLCHSRLLALYNNQRC